MTPSIDGTTGNDSLSGTAGDDTINGLAGIDTLYGLAGNDTLDGGTGADTMIGGDGDDEYAVDDAGDIVTEATNEGIDHVTSSVNYTLTTDVENLTLTGSAVSGTGNAGDNIITGDALANTLNAGTAGNDTLIGGLGSDTYIVDHTGVTVTEAVGEGTDTVSSSVNFTLGANVENLTLTGSAISATGNADVNILTGNSSANTLDGAAGADTMIGGDGNDEYAVDNTGDVVTEALNQGADHVTSSVTYTLGVNVENLTLTGAAANATGNTLDNILIGTTGDNTLDGLAGTDTMTGGGGNDTYIVDTTTDIVNGGSGTDTVRSSATYTISDTNVENLVLTGTGNSNATGNSSTNSLTGNSGDNTLDGLGGADVMIGNGGNDTFIVDNNGDSVTGGAGTDKVISSITYDLTNHAEIENLTLSGTNNIDATGNSTANILTGNSGNNTLDGGAGADTLIGNGGNDTFVVDVAADLVTGGAGTDTVLAGVSFSLASHAELENVTLTGTGNFNATGNASANTLTGNTGDNSLDGGTGADTMIGGTGNDSYTVDNIGDVVTEGTAAGTDSVTSSISYTLGANLENLTLTGTADLTATGNGGDNTITGNSGNNTIDAGLTGTDVLIGGDGSDTYIVSHTGVSVTEASGAGTGVDEVQAAVTYTLDANVENLTLTGNNNIDGTGNAGDNVLTGNGGTNVLTGGGGNDTYFVGANDTVVEGLSGGNDTVNSTVDFTLGTNIENLTLTGTAVSGTGNSGDNIITGDTAGNTLDGGTAGTDSLAGGAGNDTYNVDHAGVTVTEAFNEGTDLVNSSVTFTLGANVENLTLTGTNVINGTGNSGDNVITGNSAANTLDAGTNGTDTLVGGLGNDTYIVNHDGVTVTEGLNAGTDTVQASVSFTLGNNIENLTMGGDDVVLVGTGNSLANTLLNNATSSDVTLDGGTGADTLDGSGASGGFTTYIVDEIGDTVTGSEDNLDTVLSSVTYTISNTDVENLTLTGLNNINAIGNVNANILTGNDDDNALDGNQGNDSLVGGQGDDTYLFSNGDGNDVINEANGADTIVFDASVQTSSVTYVRSGDDLIISYGTNEDTVTVSNWFDTNSAQVEQIKFFDGTVNDVDYVNNHLGASAANDSLTGTNGSDTLAGLDGDDSVSGGAGNDVLSGDNGNDMLDGGTGTDTLSGGTGNDTYGVDSSSDVVLEHANEGIDTVISTAANYTLTSYVENLTLAGNGNINGTGNSLVNIILGNSGDNTLDGGTGADTLTGNGGNDTFIVDVAGDLVSGGAGIDTIIAGLTYSLATHTEIENLTLSGTGNFNATGNTFNNILIGNAGVNALSGLGGNDTLDGGLGADKMTGGLGDDTYFVDNIRDTVTEAAGIGSGVDSVFSSVTYTLGANVENLTLTGTAIGATGNALDNVLTGNYDDNTLNGLAGADSMIGGLGDDTYIVDNTGDVIVENATLGSHDTVISSISYELGANLENLTLSGKALIGFGNDLDNNINGNASANTLDGGLGADHMSGAAGNDTYYVDNTGDVITDTTGIDTVHSTISYTLGTTLEHLTLDGLNAINGTGNALANNMTGNGNDNALTGLAGNDTLTGNAGHDVLLGGAGADKLFGGLDNDILDGGIGADSSSGGSGADTFIFHAADVTTAANADHILDFSAAGVDHDNITLEDVLQNFNSESNINDYVHVTTSGANTILSIDVNGSAGGAHFVNFATLNGVTGLIDADHMLQAQQLIITSSL